MCSLCVCASRIAPAYASESTADRATCLHDPARPTHRQAAMQLQELLQPSSGGRDSLFTDASIR